MFYFYEDPATGKTTASLVCLALDEVMETIVIICSDWKK